MGRILFEDAYLEREYKRMQDEASRLADAHADLDDGDRPVPLKQCSKCDGLGACPCCERECERCFGRGFVGDDDAALAYEDADKAAELAGRKPQTRRCVFCSALFREYVMVPRDLRHCRAWCHGAK